MRHTTISEPAIKQLVDTFYDKVKIHPELGPVFNNAIGTTTEEWTAHLEIMYRFWSSIMLASRKYHGNPLQKHRALPAFKEELFDVWLELFSQTAIEVFCNDTANRFIKKSTDISKSFRRILYTAP